MNRQTATFQSRLCAAVLTACLALYAGPSGAESSTTSIPAPLVAPPPPPPPPQQDRKDGQGAAAAMAMMGAAVAGASCMMLMAQAQKEPDPSMKALLQSQAMQQCSQAAQSAQNAAKNDEGKDQLAKNDTPTGQQIQPTQTAAKNEEPKSTYTVPETTASTETAEVTTPTDDGQPNLEVFEPKKPSTVTVNNGNEKMAAEAESISKLKPIDNAQVKFDDSAKGGESTPGSGFSGGGAGSMSFASVGGNLNADAMKKLAQETLDAEEAAKKNRKKKNEEGGEVASGGGGAEGSSSAPGTSGTGSAGEGEAKGEDGGFNSMLASIMGGGGGGSAASSFMESHGGTFDLPGADSPRPTTSKGPNIFQYAQYRYRSYSKETSMLAKRPGTKGQRSVASVQTK